MHKRTPMPELEARLKLAAETLGLFSVHTTASFYHNKTKRNYIVQGLCFRECNMTIEVVYHPRDMPGVVFSRPMEEFRERFTRGYYDGNK